MPVDRATFVREYVRSLRDGNAALFVGAGVSRAAGYVDWKQLLGSIAEDLGLDVDREADLVALAQFHVNHMSGRNRINQLLIDEFTEQAEFTESHRLIASLPVHTVWTTNYDDLIERAFDAAQKRTDVKRRQEDFATTRRGADVTIYKMHGDRTAPAEAVLIKEDFETYNAKRELFTIALKGDLTQKTFLFLGISFDDPNVMHILSRVRQFLEGNSRQHYCLLKAPTSDGTTDAEYRVKRFGHWLGDLTRYHIQPVLIDSYDDIPRTLAELNRRSHLRDVFISGSADDFAPLGEEKFRELCGVLGAELIKNGFNVVSGFGLGVGDMVIAGAMRALPRNDGERLQLWPFPQRVTGDREAFWRDYRTRMMSHAGVCIVLSGNKKNDVGDVMPAEGVRKEVEIALSQGKAVIPIGATGYVAREIGEAANADPSTFLGDANVSTHLETLGDEGASVQDLASAVIATLRQLDR